MPEWVHNRAEHILAKNPSMPKSEAWAIATQQGHAIGKTPKGYGTAQGRHEAKAKYPTPGDDKKTANPGHLESPKMNKQASGFTANYDESGKLTHRETRMQELERIFGQDGSFGFDKTSAATMRDFSAELGEIVKEARKAKEEPGLIANARAQLEELQQGPASIVAPTIAGFGSAIGGLAAYKGLQATIGKDPELQQKLLRNIHSTPGAPELQQQTHGFFDGGAYYPATEVIQHSGESPAELAHEMGHHELFHGSKHLAARSLLYALNNPLITAALGAGAGAYAAHRKEDDPDSWQQKALMLAPILPSLPSIAEEGGAWVKGLQRLHASGADFGQLARQALVGLPAFSTYLMPAAVGVGTALATRKYLRKAQEKER